MFLFLHGRRMVQYVCQYIQLVLFRCLINPIDSQQCYSRVYLEFFRSLSISESFVPGPVMREVRGHQPALTSFEFPVFSFACFWLALLTQSLNVLCWGFLPSLSAISSCLASGPRCDPLFLLLFFLELIFLLLFIFSACQPSLSFLCLAIGCSALRPIRHPYIVKQIQHKQM